MVTYQVTNDNSLSCLHNLKTSNVQTRLINVRTTQKTLHNPDRLTVTKRQQPKPLGWIKTRLRCVSYSDESTFSLVNVRTTEKRLHNSTRTTLTNNNKRSLLVGSGHGYARCGI